MKKNVLTLIAIALTALAWTSCNNKASEKVGANAQDSTFNFAGDYQTTSTDSLTLGYYQTLTISQSDSGYSVKFSGSEIKGEPGCSFEGKGKVENDTLFINVDEKTKDAFVMIITPTKDKLGVEVGTKSEENRMKLNYYCKGGGSLAGAYYNKTVSSDKVGMIEKGMTIEDVKKLVPADRIKLTKSEGEHAGDVYDDYVISDEFGEKLLTLTPKENKEDAKIERVWINNGLYTTEKGICKFSTLGDVIKAYPELEAEPTKDAVVLKVKGQNIEFTVNTKGMKEDWWNEQTKSVNTDKIPANTKITGFYVWWE